MCKAQQDNSQKEEEKGEHGCKGGLRRQGGGEKETQSCREASPEIASPAAFLADRTDLQFPPETGRHSTLCIQPGSIADSLG